MYSRIASLIQEAVWCDGEIGAGLQSDAAAVEVLDGIPAQSNVLGSVARGLCVLLVMVSVRALQCCCCRAVSSLQTTPFFFLASSDVPLNQKGTRELHLRLI